MNPYLKLLARNRGRGCRLPVKAAADDAVEVFIYEAIVSDADEAEWFGGIAPESFVRDLRAITAGTIRLRINSPGGSVFGARAIEQALREHPARVVAHIDGLAASAATFVAMAADEVVMQPGALWMVHKAWTLAMGNADDLRATTSLLDKIDGTLVDTYARRTGKQPEQIADWMAAETWFTADEAVQAGFADRVSDAAVKAAARWDLSAYRNAPAASQPAPQQPVAVDAAALLRRLSVLTV